MINVHQPTPLPTRFTAFSPEECAHALRSQNLDACYADLVHDFRGVLSAMSINVEMISRLLAGGGDQEKAQRYLATLSHALGEFDQVANGIAWQFRPFSETPEIFDLGAVLQEIRQLIQTSKACRGRSLELDLPSANIMLHGKQALLKQVLLNLFWAAVATLPAEEKIFARVFESEKYAHLHIKLAVAITLEKDLRLARNVLLDYGGYFSLDTEADGDAMAVLKLPLHLC